MCTFPAVLPRPWHRADEVYISRPRPTRAMSDGIPQQETNRLLVTLDIMKGYITL